MTVSAPDLVVSAETHDDVFAGCALEMIIAVCADDRGLYLAAVGVAAVAGRV